MQKNNLPFLNSSAKGRRHFNCKCMRLQVTVLIVFSEHRNHKKPWYGKIISKLIYIQEAFNQSQDMECQSTPILFLLSKSYFSEDIYSSDKNLKIEDKIFCFLKYKI